MRTVRSFCRVCTSVCGILVDVEDDRVVRVRGDKDHPLSRGYTCAKGRGLPQMHHNPARLERPLVRVGDGDSDGDSDSDGLQPTTWDHCLDDLATRLRTVIDEHGPAAVGVFFGSGVGMDAAGYRTAQALHRAIGTPAKFSPLTIDGTAKVLVSDLVGGSPSLSARPDYDGARLVLYVGSNPVVSHGHGVALPDPVSSLRDLARRAEVWVVDPRRTETARLATGHLAPWPGTDHAVPAFLVREVLRDGADVAVVEHDVVDLDRLAAAVEPFDLNLGGHLVTAFPDTETLVPALCELDVLATIEIIANETTALSTHVLPTKDQLERADVTLWDALSPRVAAQHTPPVVDAVGDRRSTWWVLAELGRRLSHDLGGASGAGDAADDDARLARVTRRARASFDDLVATGWAEADHELPAP